jgi:hypothetical protein
MFRLPPDPGNPDAQAKGLAPQRASAAPSRGAGSFSGPSGSYNECPLLGLAFPEQIVAIPEEFRAPGRRTKVVEERTRGVQGAAYGDLMFWLCRGGRPWSTRSFSGCTSREDGQVITAKIRGD